MHGLRGHRLVWAVTNMVLLQETRGKGYIVQKNALGRLGMRMDPNTHMTKDGLRGALQLLWRRCLRFGQYKLVEGALRVHLAETRLTVYRRLSV